MATSAERFGEAFGGERMWGLTELPYPDPIPFIPQTGGWLLLAFLALTLLGCGIWRAHRRWRANAYRRSALAALAAVPAERTAQIPFVLRRTALAAFDRRTVASLRGEDWIGWLNERTAEPLFGAGDAELLDRLAYGRAPLPEPEVRRLVDVVRRWVSEHHA